MSRGKGQQHLILLPFLDFSQAAPILGSTVFQIRFVRIYITWEGPRGEGAKLGSFAIGHLDDHDAPRPPHPLPICSPLVVIRLVLILFQGVLVYILFQTLNIYTLGIVPFRCLKMSTKSPKLTLKVCRESDDCSALRLCCRRHTECLNEFQVENEMNDGIQVQGIIV